MPSKAGKIFRDSFLFHWYKNVSAPLEYAWWRMRGSPAGKIPHWVKQRAIRDTARAFGLRALVETGTNYAHMIRVQRRRFREIYSIEIDAAKAEGARKKFARFPAVHILQGDSGEILPRLLPELREPCLFWLDGHDFDRATPVERELAALFAHPGQNHVVLIDDAKWFNGHGGYPTLGSLRQRVARDYIGHTLDVHDESIRIFPEPSLSKLQSSPDR